MRNGVLFENQQMPYKERFDKNSEKLPLYGQSVLVKALEKFYSKGKVLKCQWPRLPWETRSEGRC